MLVHDSGIQTKQIFVFSTSSDLSNGNGSDKPLVLFWKNNKKCLTRWMRVAIRLNEWISILFSFRIDRSRMASQAVVYGLFGSKFNSQLYKKDSGFICFSKLRRQYRWKNNGTTRCHRKRGNLIIFSCLCYCWYQRSSNFLSSSYFDDWRLR